MQHYLNGRFAESIRLLEALIIEAPSSELWNDWATAQLAAGNRSLAADGFAQAVQLDPSNHAAAINHGVVLCMIGCVGEGRALLERLMDATNETERVQLRAFIASIGNSKTEVPREAVPDTDVRAESEKPEDKSLNVLVIHEFLPHADRHGADLQWMQMLAELRAQGHSVTHIARSDVGRERYEQDVTRLGIKVLTPDAERMRYAGLDAAPEWRLEELMRRERFDLAILTHWFWNAISIPEHYVEDIRRISPSTFVAVLTDDQHGLREKQMADITHRWNDYERVADFSAREMEVYRRADCVLTISDDDARAFRAVDPGLRTARMPMIAEIAPEGPGFDERAGLIFLANFDNPANSDAATWFLSEIWPRVRRNLSEVELALVGNGLPDDPRFYGPGIVRVGFAPNLAPEFAKRRVAVSPVRFGTGIKTKNLLALAHAVPLVTTQVGADGMNLVNGDSALIADTAEEFAAAVIQAHSDDALWRQLSTLGRRHIASEFSAARMTRAVGELCEMARTVAPRPYEPRFCWSFRRVEAEAPECLTAQPAQRRPTVRVEAYVNYAARLFAEGRHKETLAQLRHFFGLLRGPVKATSLTIRAMEMAAHCYRTLSDEVKASDYEERVRRSCALDGEWKSSAKKQRAHAGAAVLEFSVIVPTYNRADILRECLEALERQTVAPEHFEVIVVDDGSSDGTSAVCREFRSGFALRYLRQTNAGAGAARRRGVQHSRGKFLLFINDDTVADADLLAVHAATHEKHAGERQAVLGNFRFPAAAESRALTRFLSENPFLFPQVNLAPGVHWDYTKFVTCNASIRRDAVVGVGSFDADFRIAEDSELGLRLSRRGYYVRYVPEARAVHEHLPFTVGDLVRRAETYGAVHLQLLRKHPGLLGDGSTSYGRLDRQFAEEWRAKLAPRCAEIRDAEEAIAKFDSIDFLEFERGAASGPTLAADVMKMFRRVVPEVYFHHFYSSVLRAWEHEQQNALMRSGPKPAAQHDVYL